jgi:hypothetical protein
MNLHSLLTGPANGAAHLNPINLFLDADIVVQLIMAGCCWPASGCGRS